MRVHPKTGVVTVDHPTFRKLDYAQICERLGLRPSQPWHNAAGKYVGPRRKRKRKKTAVDR